MFNFKTTIRKWAGLPFQDVTNLLTWSDGKSVDFGNRNLLIASDLKERADSRIHGCGTNSHHQQWCA